MAQSLDEMAGGTMDSRDLIARHDELVTDAEIASADGVAFEEADELAELVAILADGEQEFEDWEYGVVLVPEDEFEDHARELAEDLGVTIPDQWPFRHIDWEAAADALKDDYSEIEIRGVTYYGH